MAPDYESYLIVNHPTILDFYIRGIQVAIYHKDTKAMEVKNSQRLPEFVDAMKEALDLTEASVVRVADFTNTT